MAPPKKRLVVLISGRGSNMVSILNACNAGQINGQIVAVISNKASAAGLDIAREAGVATEIVDHKAYASREEFDKELLNTVLNYNPDVVILAGFMRILTAVFVRPLIGRLINIHPSLLPKYPGLNTHQRAIDAGDRHGGATVHFVTEQLDGGPAIIQAQVAILPEDSADELASRVLEREHEIYAQAVKLICDQSVSFSREGKTTLNGDPLPEHGILANE